MSVYKLWNEKLSVEDVGKVSLHELLNIKRYGKIYIMLGINELGYKIEKTIAENEEMIRKIKGQQPEATIYLCALCTKISVFIIEFLIYINIINTFVICQCF